MKRNILITGGAGFIGSHVVRLFVKKYPDYDIYNLDALTYCGNLENLSDIKDYPNYHFIKCNICDKYKLEKVFKDYNITDIIHLAAESHVDRSISGPMQFVQTNVVGTCNLLDLARKYWEGEYDQHRFHHVSTDEVYGALEMNNDKFKESTPYSPHSPYSASKASSDHFVRAYHDTFGLNITISNCSNNYGPNQFPEKLIPLVINNLLEGKDIPVYGTGKNVRDWIYVEDHAKAIDTIFHNGKSGQTYCVGGNNELTNIEIIETLIRIVREGCESYLIKPKGISQIKYIADRKGHDLRYAIDSSKIMNELGWYPETNFEDGMYKTVGWYLENRQWMQNIVNGEYQNYYKKQYS